MSRRRSKKSNVKILLIVIAIVVILGGVGYILYNKIIYSNNKAKVIFNDKLDVEINDEVVLSTFIKEIKNGVLLNNDDKVDTSKLGKKKIELVIKDKNKEEEKINFNINIVDTTKPKIEAKNEVSTYVGNKIDLLKDVKVSDNSMEEISAKVTGEYDINKAGEYKLKYEASDSSKNKSEMDFVLKVISDPNNRTFTTSKEFSGKVVNGVTYIDGYLIANKSYNLPSSYGPGLLSSTRDAFNKMQGDAKAIGFNLYIGSGYRSYYDQKYIYNNYVARDGQAAADTYSARAGHSEHQTGLAIDVCDYGVTACVSSGFDNTAQAKWISDNCYRYGFILRYLKGKESVTGYMYESWHLRYVGVDLATKLYNNGNWIALEDYFGIDSKYS